MGSAFRTAGGGKGANQAVAAARVGAVPGANGCLGAIDVAEAQPALEQAGVLRPGHALDQMDARGLLAEAVLLRGGRGGSPPPEQARRVMEGTLRRACRAGGGRFLFGVGAGWRSEEIANHGTGSARDGRAAEVAGSGHERQGVPPAPGEPDALRALAARAEGACLHRFPRL